MAWSAEFLEALAQGSRSYRYLLESVDDAPGPSGVGSLRLSSYAEPGYSPTISTAGSSLSNATGSLAVPDWGVSWGSWAVALAGTPSGLAGVVTRGTVCQLRVGLPGWATSQFQPVALGSLWQIRKSGGQYTLEFRELGSRLGSRGTGISSDDNGLFYDLSPSQATTISRAYIPGDGTLYVNSTAPFTAPGTIQLRGDDQSLFLLRFTGIGIGTLTGLSTVDIHHTKQVRARIGRPVFLGAQLTANYVAGDATVTLSSTAGLSMRSGTSPYGAVVITPTTGDPFVVTYTGTAAGPTRITGCSASDVYGTRLQNAASGSACFPTAHDNAHPVRLARRMLLSTGTSGAHGVEDLYPSPWGFGYPPELVDESDMDWMERNAKPASGAPTWTMLATEAQADPLAWLQAFLAPGGYFVATRQGRLTCRAQVNALTAQTPDHAAITDADIAAIESYEAWDSSYSVEYTKHRITTPDGAETTAETAVADTWPALALYDTDLPSVTENQAAWRTEVAVRIGLLRTRIPEVVILRLAGHRFAGLSRGDTVVLSCRALVLRDGVAAVGKEGFVRAIHPDWFGSSTLVEIVLPSQFENEFGR